MMVKESLSLPLDVGGSNHGGHSPVGNEDSTTYSRHSLDKEYGLAACRVCQCAESDKGGETVLGFLGIVPPLQEPSKANEMVKCKSKEQVPVDMESGNLCSKNFGRSSTLVEFISPEGEVFICDADLELGLNYQQHDSLIELGCSCKNDLSLAHYACALKWFVNHGSTICEICGQVAKNINLADFHKVVISLKDYQALRERTAQGDPNPTQVHTSSSVDPDAVAAIRRQRLSEISLWFGPQNTTSAYNNSAADSHVSEQALNTGNEDDVHAENPATKWAVEATGILLATGLLTVTLAWLIAPRVGKKTAKSGLHILLGGICALTVVIFFRFFVLSRIKYGPARYWAILFVFWFLVFGIWASRSHSAHTT